MYRKKHRKVYNIDGEKWSDLMQIHKYEKYNSR